MHSARQIVVVPTDFSSLSLQAIEPALRQCAHGHSTLHLLYVVDDVELLATSVDQKVTAKMTRGLMEEARQHFARLQPRLNDQHHHFAIRTGRPADAIVAYAAEVDADLIVMATHGRHGVARAFLGSITENVIRNARCPVLSVRPQEAVVAS